MVDSKVQRLLHDKDLKLIEVLKKPDGGLVRSYLVITQNSRGTKYVLKYFDSSDYDSKRRFIREIKLIRRLRAKLPNGYKSWVVNIKWYSIKSSNPYYIYKYIEGETIGHFVQDFGINWGQFKDKNFDYFIKFFTALNKTDIGQLSDEIGRWDSWYIDKELDHYFKNIPDLLTPELREKFNGFYDRKKQYVFRKMVVSHRDLYPENIILSEKFTTNFTFLDFEYMSWVPIGFDAAFMYLLFWREDYWKGKIFSYYYNYYECDKYSSKRKTFITSFRFCLAILGIRFLYQIQSWGDKDDRNYRQANVNILFDIQSALNNTVYRPRSIKFYVTKLDLQKIADKYNLGAIVKYQIFYASKGNTVAKVYTSKGKSPYIFRLYSQLRSRSLIKRELEILNKLSQNGVKTYHVINNPEGGLYIKMMLYGLYQRVAVLSYVKGNKIKKEWADEKAAYNAGLTLRSIHDLGIVHGDFSKENVLFVTNYVTGVIDFEWGRFTNSRDAKLNDLAKAIALWLIDIRLKHIDDNEFTLKFIEGYLGRKPERHQLESIIERLVDKIEEERVTFLNTAGIETTSRKVVGARFDNAVQKVMRLL